MSLFYRLKGGTLVIAHTVTRFISPAYQCVNVLDGHPRLIGWNYLPLCQLPQHATFCFRNTLYLHFAECLCAFHLVNICRARRLSIPLYRFVGTKIHIKLYLSSTFTIFNITLTFVYNKEHSTPAITKKTTKTSVLYILNRLLRFFKIQHHTETKS